MTATALSLGRQWCHGHEVGGEPALRHALRVTQILHRHIPDAPPDLLAAALVHDAPDFAPTDDLDVILSGHMSSDPATYWRQRHGFVTALPYFRTFLQAGVIDLPASMAGDLDRLIDEADRTIRRCRIGS